MTRTYAFLVGAALALASITGVGGLGCNAQPNATQCSTGIFCPEGTQCAAVQAVCLINSCGNGITDPGEVCDDGNIMDGDGCSHDCLSKEVCGNGIKDPGETCDLGSANGAAGCTGANCCSADCKSNETCGNGILDPGETCDLGSANGTPDCVVDAAGDNCCSLNCQSNETCGNCIVDPGEACDTCANTGTPNPACEAGCLIGTGCGNGVVDHSTGEVCDDGNMVNTDDCTNACQPNVCGDGIVDSTGSNHHEDCDDGSGQGPVEGSDCNLNCTTTKCGDGIVNKTAGEQCDNGSDNGSGKNCTDTCKVNVCGDGKVDNEAPNVEECDDGSNNGVGSDPCSVACTLPSCGNRIVDPGEQCDDGNTNPNDACQHCKNAVCGDGIVETGVEQCDGAPINGHACSANCTLEQCGNGIIDPGETCDDGNTVSGDGCGSSCLVEFCGDGIKNNVTEKCDPAGTVSPNTPAQCNSDCTLASCGDGKVDHNFVPPGAPGGEQCDPPSSATGCSTTCQLEKCGDGHIDTNLGEVCDNGSGNSLNGPCLPWCQLATCGDGVIETHSNVTGAETCDEGSANGTTACDYGDASCTVCSAQCKAVAGTTSFCGDHTIDTGNGENCDDATDGQTECAYKATNSQGNTCTVCSAGCQSSTAAGPYCGDALIQSPQEGCDFGFARNGQSACGYGAKSCTVCSAACASVPGTTFSFCGDGTKNGPEACDSGVAGVETDSTTCNKDCTAPSCGDGYVNTKFTPPGAAGPEQCEPPNSATCDAHCRISAFCGDGTCNGGEDACSCPADCTGTCDGTCGDGHQETGEECDGADLNGASCTSLGFGAGTLTCNGACNFDVSACTSKCGNGVIEGSEECDGTHLGAATCQTLGYSGGSLSCSAGCTFVVTSCKSVCGNNNAETGEQCDGTDLNGGTCGEFGFSGGTLGCTLPTDANPCEYDVTACTP